MEIDEILKELGFSEYKIKLYKTLLSFTAATPREVAKEANVPVTRAYGILEELAKEGFVAVLPGKPTKYRALPPSSTILPLLEIKINKIKELEEKVKKIEDEITFSPIPKGEILFFQGWNTIRKIFLKDTEDSRSEILLFVRFGQMDTKMWEKLEGAIKKGASIKVLGPYIKEREITMFKYKNIGCKVKIIKNFPLIPLITFSVRDSKLVYIEFFSQIGKEERFLARIEDESTAKFFKQIFEKLWESAENLK
jgi:sugar-specific transcriptional regulator TrmB